LHAKDSSGDDDVVMMMDYISRSDNPQHDLCLLPSDNPFHEGSPVEMLCPIHETTVFLQKITYAFSVFYIFDHRHMEKVANTLDNLPL
jgi:hypothetical protein